MVAVRAGLLSAGLLSAPGHSKTATLLGDPRVSLPPGVHPGRRGIDPVGAAAAGVRAVGRGAEHTTADAADTGTPRQVRHARTRLPRGEARVIGRLGRQGTASPVGFNTHQEVRSAVEAITGRRNSAGVAV